MWMVTPVTSALGRLGRASHCGGGGGSLNFIVVVFDFVLFCVFLKTRPHHVSLAILTLDQVSLNSELCPPLPQKIKGLCLQAL